MTTLFRHLQPAKKFHIPLSAIARALKIPQHLIVRVECWEYVIFVHRRDKGGQFISYRKLQQWVNAVACQIQQCSTRQQLRSLWFAIAQDYQRHEKQYDPAHRSFLYKLWTKHWDALAEQPDLPESSATAGRVAAIA